MSTPWTGEPGCSRTDEIRAGCKTRRSATDSKPPPLHLVAATRLGSLARGCADPGGAIPATCPACDDLLSIAAARGTMAEGCPGSWAPVLGVALLLSSCHGDHWATARFCRDLNRGIDRLESSALADHAARKPYVDSTTLTEARGLSSTLAADATHLSDNERDQALSLAKDARGAASATSWAQAAARVTEFSNDAAGPLSSECR